MEQGEKQKHKVKNQQQQQEKAKKKHHHPKPLSFFLPKKAAKKNYVIVGGQKVTLDFIHHPKRKRTPFSTADPFVKESSLTSSRRSFPVRNPILSSTSQHWGVTPPSFFFKSRAPSCIPRLSKRVKSSGSWGSWATSPAMTNTRKRTSSLKTLRLPLRDQGHTLTLRKTSHFLPQSATRLILLS